MRVVYAALLIAILALVPAARADVIINGSVMTADAQGTDCSISGMSTSALDLDCNDSNSDARVAASADPLSGSASLDVFVPGYLFPSGGLAQGSVQLDLNETYMMVGGSGTTTATFYVNASEALAGTPPNLSCSFKFGDSAAQSCVFGPVTFTETMQYNVPYSLQLDVLMDGISFYGEPGDSRVIYNFAQSGLVVTPEPPSIVLLLSALTGALLVFAKRNLTNMRTAATQV